MKISSIALLCLLVSCAVHGQTKHRTQISHIAVAGVNKTKNKTTAVSSRLVGEASSVFQGGTYQEIDSARYIYRGLNGQYVDNLYSWNFDTANVFMFDGSTSSYNHYGRTQRAYNINGFCVRELQQTKMPGGWQTNVEILMAYDSRGNFTTHQSNIDDGSGAGLQKHRLETYSFNANDELLSVLFQEWDGVTWVNKFHRSSVFNAAHQPTSGLLQMWNDATGKWDTLSREILAYNGGQLTDDTYENYANGVFTPATTFSSTYNAAGDKIQTETLDWDATLGAWGAIERSSYSYDNNHNLMEELQDEWQSTIYEPWMRKAYTYNTFDQELTYEEQMWDANLLRYTVQNDCNRYRNYYEEFSGVADVNKQTMVLNIYPVPARDELTISLNTSQHASVLYFVSDMNGQVVTKWADKGGVQYSKQINTASMPSGTYMLHVQAGNDIQTKKFTVVH